MVGPAMEFQFDPHRTILGTAFTAAGEEEIALSERDRLQHVLAIGKTGRGKTTLLENMLVQDLYAGNGVGLIDPHGDLSRSLLDHFPSFRARDLVLIEVDRRQLACEQLPFADRTFDCVVSTWTLCSIAGAGQALSEVRRVLKPSGG